MLLRELAIAQVITFALVMTRLAGFVAVSPFPGSQIPMSARVGLTIMLAWVASMFAPSYAAPTELGPKLVGAIATELACGIMMAFTYQIIVSAADIVGSALAEATGLNSARTFDPSRGSEQSSAATLVTTLAMLLALSVGAHRIALGYLLESFRALPVGTHLDIGATAKSFVDLTAASIGVGVRLSMPLVAVHLIVQFALALVARAAPALQIFSVGFGVMMASGAMVFLASINDIARGFLAHYASLGSYLDKILLIASGQ